MCFAAAGEDNQLMSKDLEVSVAEVDAEGSRHSEEISSVGNATDEGGTSQEHAHVALPEEAGEEEVVLYLFLFILLGSDLLIPS
jgi:hypothetical protein